MKKSEIYDNSFKTFSSKKGTDDLDEQVNSFFKVNSGSILHTSLSTHSYIHPQRHVPVIEYVLHVTYRFKPFY